MDAVLDWSFRLLGANEQLAFRRLGIFAAGFSSKAQRRSSVTGSTRTTVPRPWVARRRAARQRRPQRQCDPIPNARDRAHVCPALARRGGRIGRRRGRAALWALERIGPWHPMDRARSGEIEVELDTLRELVPLLRRTQSSRRNSSPAASGATSTRCTSRERTAELAQYAVDLAAPSPARVSLLATLALLHVHDGEVDAARRVVDDAVHASEIAGGPPPWDDVAVERAMGEVELRSGNYDAAAEIARRTLDRELSPRGRGRMLNLLGISSHFLGDAESAAVAFKLELEIASLLADGTGEARRATSPSWRCAAGCRLRRSTRRRASTSPGPGPARLGLAVAHRGGAVDGRRRSVRRALQREGRTSAVRGGRASLDDDLRASQEVLHLAEQRLGGDDSIGRLRRGRADAARRGSLRTAALAEVPRSIHSVPARRLRWLTRTDRMALERIASWSSVVLGARRCCVPPARGTDPQIGRGCRRPRWEPSTSARRTATSCGTAARRESAARRGEIADLPVRCRSYAWRVRSHNRTTCCSHCAVLVLSSAPDLRFANPLAANSEPVPRTVPRQPVPRQPVPRQPVPRQPVPRQPFHANPSRQPFHANPFTPTFHANFAESALTHHVRAPKRRSSAPRECGSTAPARLAAARRRRRRSRRNDGAPTRRSWSSTPASQSRA